MRIAVLILLLLFPVEALAGYGQGGYYSQGGYYGQSYYQSYYEASYSLTITRASSALGSFAVTGNLSKGSGSFVIDHPLDPADKILYHFFVESPDAKNLYDGLAILDVNGEAVVALPSYFEALNGDYRYQVKPIGESMPNLYIKSKVKDNSFVIAGGVAGGKVSWQVTGIRHDRYVLDNPIPVEMEKGSTTLVNKGEFITGGYEQMNWIDWLMFTLTHRLLGH